MAENNFMRFIPPNLRGPLTDLGIFGRVAADNIIGLDDDYESTGEMLGTAFREDPVGLAKDLGTGIYEGAKSIYDDPGGAYDAFTTSLGETIDRLNTPYDQLDLSTEEAQRQRAGDLMIFGEALGVGGALTKGLVSLGKKQLRERVARENPGLNADQVNAIVEDRGYDPSTYISPQLDPFRDVYDPRDGDFIGDPTSEIDQAYNRGELVPIVTTADGQVIGTANPNRVEDLDVDGNLYGPPDAIDEDDLFAGFDEPPDVDEDELRIRRENEADAVGIDAAYMGMEPPVDMNDPAPRIINPALLDAEPSMNYLTDARVGQELSLPYGEARNQQIVDLSDMSNDFTTLNLANFPTAMIINGERVDVPPFTNLDEDTVRLRTIRDVGDRYVIGYQDVDSRGRDAYTGEMLAGATEIDDLVSTLRERFDNMFRGVDTTYGTSTASVISNSVREWMERIETNSFGDETPFNEYAVIPPNYNYADNDINIMQFMKDYLKARGLNANQADLVALQIKRRARENENRVAIRAEQEYGDYEGDAAYYEEYDPVLTGEGYDPANPDPDYVPEFDEAAYNRSRYIDRAGGYNQPGYESFAEQLNIDLTAKQRDPLEVEASDVSLTGGSSALSSKLDGALDDLMKTQTKFPSLNQLIKTLENKYGIKEAEFEARGVGGNIILDDGPVDLEKMNPFGLDPFVIRTLDGADVSYRDYFTKGATNYKETLITLKNPSLLSLGAGDNKHYQYAQTKMQAPLVVHMRTGNFPMASKPGENVKKKTFHLGEIQSQGTQDATISRKLRRSVEQFTEDLLNPFADGKFVGLYGETKPFDIADVLEDLDKVRVLEDQIKTLERRNRQRTVDEYTDVRLGQIDQAQADLKAIKDKYMVFDAETGRTDGSSYLDEMEPGFREILQEQGLIKKNGSFKIDSLNSAPDFHSLVVSALNESERINVDDMGVGSLFNQKQILPLAIKESLQQAANSDSDFFTLGSPEMVKKMTFGDLEGQEEYYGKFVPKAFNKVMEQLEKKNDVKLPRLSEQIIETFDDDGKTLIEQKVLGIEITDELREVFKSGKVEAFRKGGLVTLAKEVL